MISAWLAWPDPAWPITLMLRTWWKPGVSVGTRIMLALRCGDASGSVTAMTIAKSAPSADDVNHFWPLMT